MEVESVLEFLRKNGFAEAATALKEDMRERKRENVVVDDSLFDFEMFLFPMMPPPPPVRVQAIGNKRLVEGGGDKCCSRSSSDEFMSLGSSSSNVCSSEFTNPYGILSATEGNSKASSENLSTFDTARDCRDFDTQNDLYWYDDKDEGNFMTPCFNGSDPFCFPSEDKFVMTLEREKLYEDPLGSTYEAEVFQSTNSTYLDKPCLFDINSSTDYVNNGAKTNDYHKYENSKMENVDDTELYSPATYRSSAPICKCGTVGTFAQDPANYSHQKFNEFDYDYIQFKVEEDPTKNYSASKLELSNSADEHSTKMRSTTSLVGLKSEQELQCQDEKDLQRDRCYAFDAEAGENVDGDSHKPEADGIDEEGVISDELLTYNAHEEEYEVFDLRIIHRKNRTGFEENKELPIVLNTVIAGRYYVTDYLGSAAFSRVVQAHDFHTGIDVCLKIIKNDKDFFDQSLDEIKLLKFVNKYDPADERHILRIYDYFYHQFNIIKKHKASSTRRQEHEIIVEKRVSKPSKHIKDQKLAPEDQDAEEH